MPTNKRLLSLASLYVGEVGVRGFIVAAALLVPAGSVAQVQVNQTFVAQGPAPSLGPLDVVQSGDAPPNGTVSGAVEAVLLDPALGANTMFIGSVNGGIWSTTNGGTTWSPLTDHQASLSIASLALDPTDPLGKTLIAGVGLTSAGNWDQFNSGTSFVGRGGQQTGLLYSTNGGSTWTPLGAAQLSGQSVTGVAAMGQTILAATFEPNAPNTTTTAGRTPSPADYGLYRSVNGGTSFGLVSPTSGLPSGPVTSLVADPRNSSSCGALNSCTFYAAVTSPTNPQATGVFISKNSGATWSAVFTSATAVSGGSNFIGSATTQLVPKLAAGPNGSVAIAIVNSSGGFMGRLQALYLSQNSGASWSTLAVPVDAAGANLVNPGNQGAIHLAVAIDPKNTSIVYVAGDRITNEPFTVPAFRVQGNQFTSLTDPSDLPPGPNTSNGSTAHADARAFAFDAAGNLLMGGDGGIYMRSNPQSNNGAWTGLNTSTLDIREPYAVAYGANAKRLIVAAQDTGVAVQSAPNMPLYNAIQGGDGVTAVVSDKTFPSQSVYYSSSQELGGLSRLVLDSQGNRVSPGSPVTDPEGVPVKCSINGGPANSCGPTPTFQGVVQGATFLSPFVLNRVDSTKVAVAGTNVYVATDTAPANASTVDLQLTNLGTTGTVTALAYGTADNPNVVLAGGGNPTSTPISDNPSVGLAGSDPPGALFLSTTGTAGSIKQVTDTSGTPTYTGMIPTSLAFDQRSQNRFYVADSNKLWGTQNQGATALQDLTPNLPANITRPTSVEFINNNGVDALLVGGLSSTANAQSQITVADSNANGDLSGWRPFGSGLPNVLVSQMSYNPLVDVLALSGVGRGAWALYDVTSYFPQATTLQFGLANNDSLPDASFLTDGTTLNGTGFSRPLNKFGTGTLTVAGNATYTGATTVIGGTLLVNGSIAPSSGVAVNAGATLAGTGTVSATTIMSGGILAPGNAVNPTGTLTVAGNLALQSGILYLVQVNPVSASSTDVSGTASLAGTVNAAFAPGSYVPKHYLILQSAGLGGTTFSSLTNTNLPLNFADSLSYSANDAFLNLIAALGAGTALNINQQNVANAINNFFNSGGTLPPGFANLFNLTGASLANVLTQLSGEAGTGAERTAVQLTNEFLTLMLDPFVNGRGYASGGPGGAVSALGFAPDEQASWPPDVALAYAPILTKAPPQPPFAQRWTAWGSAYGGSNSGNGNATVGSNNVTANAFGFAGGMDYHLSPTAIVGFALAGAGTNWGLPNALGGGRSDALQVGAYGIDWFGPAYLAGALAFSNHWFTTNRSALGEQLTAKFDGQSYGARIEGGYRYAMLPTLGVTPYGAVQFQDFHTPAYGETDVIGQGFGLSYNAMSATDVRTELGSRFDAPTFVYGMPVVLYGRVAWAHDFVDDPALSAGFQALPGTNFTVFGAPIPHDSALASAGAKLLLSANWSLIAKFDGEFASSSQTYAGSGTLRYTW